MKKIILAVLCLFFVVGCGAKKVYTYENPFNITETSLRTILGSKETYVDQEVTVGPLIITSHDLSSNIFVMSPIDEKGNIDTEVTIDVYYGQLSAKSTWVESKKGDILFIRGGIRHYRYSTTIYLHAHNIKYLDFMEIK